MVKYRRLERFKALAAVAVAMSLFSGSTLAQDVELDLELQRSDNLQDWESIPVVAAMVNQANGKIRLPLDSEAGFFRLMVQIARPNPAPEGFALIPAGSFLMGNNRPSDGTSLEHELPVHSVEVPAFYIGRAEVTKAEWDLVRTWANANGYGDLAAGSGKGADHPVQEVNWFDAVKWLNAWSQLDGLDPVYLVGGMVYKSGVGDPVTDTSANGYRLPTEAEWEKAGRGGLNGQRFSWGNTIEVSQANYRGNGGLFAYDLSNHSGNHPDFDDGTQPPTSPVGSFSPNGYGVYDTTGNVWEWVNDWFGEYYYSESPAVDPQGPSGGTQGIIRGGAWNSTANNQRLSARLPTAKDLRLFSIGFRAARNAVN